MLTSNASPAPGAVVGTVHRLWRYPVKSMAGESLTQAQLTWAGIAGDRRWAFLRRDALANGFPWHTIRDYPLMCRYAAHLTDPDRPDKSDVDVHTPTGETFRVHDPTLAAELGPGVRVIRLDRGTFDAMPVSLITTPTVSALCQLTQVPSNDQRFRPNIVITASGDRPFTEDDWVGSVLRIGEAAVRVDARDTRCIVVNVNPDTGRPDAQLLKLIGRTRQARVGVYGTIVQRGRMSVADPVRVAD